MKNNIVLEELKTSLECGEISHDMYECGCAINFDINAEDITLFMQDMYDLIDMQNVNAVCYNCQPETDVYEVRVAYDITFNDGHVETWAIPEEYANTVTDFRPYKLDV